VFVIRLLDREEVHAAEGDKLTINDQTGVLTVSRVDGFEEVTTHYSPSAWASVTHRVKEAVVKRHSSARTRGKRRSCAPSRRQRDGALGAVLLRIGSLRLELPGDRGGTHYRVADLVSVKDFRRQGVAAPVTDAAICVDTDASHEVTPWGPGTSTAATPPTAMRPCRPTGYRA
jgi:hypothetical protein